MNDDDEKKILKEPRPGIDGERSASEIIKEEEDLPSQKKEEAEEVQSQKRSEEDDWGKLVEEFRKRKSTERSRKVLAEAKNEALKKANYYVAKQVLKNQPPRKITRECCFNANVQDKILSALQPNKKEANAFIDVTKRYLQREMAIEEYLVYVEGFGFPDMLLVVARCINDPEKQNELISSHVKRCESIREQERSEAEKAIREQERSEAEKAVNEEEAKKPKKEAPKEKEKGYAILMDEYTTKRSNEKGLEAKEKAKTQARNKAKDYYRSKSKKAKEEPKREPRDKSDEAKKAKEEPKKKPRDKGDVQEDATGGVQRFRVKLLAETYRQTTTDVLCQIGLDGLRMLDPSTSRTLRSYPLENISRCKKLDSSVLAFWAKTPVDIEARRIRLQSNSYTTNTLLDTVTAVMFQAKEIGGSSRPPASARLVKQSAEKKKGLGHWMNTVKPENEEKDHWVPDEAVSKCTSCGSDFGAFMRRHHCRNCGDVFCDKCTQGRIALTAEDNAPQVRVCDRCMIAFEGRI